jgi:hypothetical protein
MLEVALDRFLGVVARMEGMTVRHVRVVRSLLVHTGLLVLRRFLVVSRGVLVVFSRLLMMFSRLFGHRIPPVRGELPSDSEGLKDGDMMPGTRQCFAPSPCISHTQRLARHHPPSRVHCCASLKAGVELEVHPARRHVVAAMPMTHRTMVPNSRSENDLQTHSKCTGPYLKKS